MKYNFYDTSSLLLRADDLFNDPDEQIIISTITLKELEEIKTNGRKSEDIKYQARKLTALLDQYTTEYTVWIYNDFMLTDDLSRFGTTNDIKILATAVDYDKECHPDEVTFITNDLALKNIANTVFGSDSIKSVEPKTDTYHGYKEVFLTEEEMCKFYENPSFNHFDLYINEYVVIHEESGDPVDAWKWDGTTHQPLRYTPFPSEHFGNIKPYKDDIYQTLAADSLCHNKLTMLKGPAGSGKTILSLGYLMNRLETGKIEKIIIFCNTVATANSAHLGFYPGSRDEKLLDSQIGNLLASKFGGRIEVERMIDEELLVLLPMSDIRGYDTTGMKAGIYISEAQNLDITLMKLALQRIGEDSVCIIDGDADTQVDHQAYAGHNNGMRRVSQVFRGSDIYGEVELQKIHRSKIASLAENL